MEIRIFQIFVPLVALVFVISLFIHYRKEKSPLSVTVISMLFWIAVGFFAIWPDKISNTIASAFGIKSNINAVIFFSLGIIFFILFKIYNLIKEQEKSITLLTRKLALKDYEKEDA